MFSTALQCLRTFALATGVLVLGACGAEGKRSSEATATSATKTRVTHVKVEEAAKYLAENRGTVILDLRTPKEFADGHLAGAKNVDFNGSDFAGQLARLDREATYLIHCAVGGRSTKALATFERLGFRSVVHLDGGFNAWRGAGKPFEK